MKQYDTSSPPLGNVQDYANITNQINGQSTTVRVPKHSRQHPIIPNLYVAEWRHDMKNRNHLIENCNIGGVPHYEHDDNMFFRKKEQLSYNCETRGEVLGKYAQPPRGVLIDPRKHHHSYKHKSSLLYYNA